MDGVSDSVPIDFYQVRETCVSYRRGYLCLSGDLVRCRYRGDGYKGAMCEFRLLQYDV